MPEHLLFLTGRLARARVERVLAEMAPTPFTFDVCDIGVKVAALMTADIIRRRMPSPSADRVILPGRFRGDLEALSAHFGVPFVRGPNEISDLPAYFGRAGRKADLSRHDVMIFAEIVDAAALDVPAILQRAALYRADGAEVIDLGCLPDTPFPHLEPAIAALHAAGYRVSVDSASLPELKRAARAGADYVLSLTEETLEILEEGPAVPVLIPARSGDLESLARAIAGAEARSRAYFADPVLDPIHSGLTESICRYRLLRERFPAAPMLMGIGNLTELTDSDTSGVTALLMGIVSELRLSAVLVVQVSPHCRRAIVEADRARRIMFAAREAGAVPVGFDDSLLCLRDRKPFASTPEEIADLAATISDDNFRIEVAADGIHIYNRRLHRVAGDPFALFPALGVERDGAHAFYLGVEAARAEIAFCLGKRYEQDGGLRWGSAVAEVAGDLTRQPAAGTTLAARRRRG